MRRPASPKPPRHAERHQQSIVAGGQRRLQTGDRAPFAATPSRRREGHDAVVGAVRTIACDPLLDQALLEGA